MRLEWPMRYVYLVLTVFGISIFVLVSQTLKIRPIEYEEERTSRLSNTTRFHMSIRNGSNYSIEILRQPITAVKKCARGSVTLVMVTSVPKDFAIRQAIRETWAAYAVNRTDMALVFVIGEAEGEELEREAIRCGDLLLTSITDTYRNLPLKTYTMLHWATRYCPLSACLLKTDSDVVVFLNNLQQLCNQYQRKQKSIIVGHCWDRAAVVRDAANKKQYVPPADYNNKSYPRYCSGTGYALTGDVPKLLVSGTKNVPWLFLEDVLFTGVIAETLSIPRIMNPNFAYIRQTNYDGCAVQSRLTSHGFDTAEGIREIWSRFMQDSSKVCVANKTLA